MSIMNVSLDPSLFSMPDFHGDAYAVWNNKHCFTDPKAPYDVCPTWYPTETSKNPWMAPGSAPVFSPCGIAGGNPFGIEGCEGDPTEFCTWGGYAYGPDARHWTGLKEAITTGCRRFNLCEFWENF